MTPALPAASWSLRSVYARGLATVAAPTLWWTLAIAGITEELLSALFVFVPLLIMIFAVTQASRWGADEDEGRKELILATVTFARKDIGRR